MLHFVGGYLHPLGHINEPTQRREWWIQQNPGLATQTLVGTSNGVTQNSPSPGASNLLGSAGNFIQCGCALVNTDAGWVTTVFTITRRAWFPWFVFDLGFYSLAAITNTRVWIGLFSASPMATDTPGASGISGAGFRFSSTAGDANWKAVVSSGAADTVADLAPAKAFSQGLGVGGEIIFDTMNNNVIFRIADEGTLPLTRLYTVAINTTLPAAATNLGVVSMIRNVTANAQKYISMSRWALAQNFTFIM